MYRHGDLSFHPITALEAGFAEVEHKGQFVLALGEATGHQHVIKSPNMRIFQRKGRTVLEVREIATLTHEEHLPIEFKPGLYEMKQEREFDWFTLETVRVLD